MRRNVSKTLIFAISLILVQQATLVYSQETYQTEVAAYFVRVDPHAEGRDLYSTLALARYLTPVKTDDHPYAAAAFLEKTGNFGFSVSQSDSTAKFFKGDGKGFNLSLNYAAPDFPLVIGTNLGRSVSDSNYSTLAYIADYESTYDRYSISIGKYISYGLLIQAGYGYSVSKSIRSIDWTSLPPENNTSYYRFSEYDLSVYYVKEFAGETALGITASLEQQDYKVGDERKHNYYVRFSGDYYFNRRLSAGLGFASSNTKSESGDGKIYSADVRYFITPRLSLAGTYERFLNDNDGMPDADFRAYHVVASARF